MAMTISIDACASARATILAAELQAEATRHAGNYTLIAGGLAFAAALVAARMQVTLDWAKERAKSGKFYSKLYKHIVSIDTELEYVKASIAFNYGSNVERISYAENRLAEFRSAFKEAKSTLAQEDNPMTIKTLKMYELVFEDVSSSLVFIEKRLLDLRNPQINLEEVLNDSSMKKSVDKALDGIGRILYSPFYRIRW